MTQYLDNEDFKKWLEKRPKITQRYDALALALRLVSRVIPLLRHIEDTADILTLVRGLESAKHLVKNRKNNVNFEQIYGNTQFTVKKLADYSRANLLGNQTKSQSTFSIAHAVFDLVAIANNPNESIRHAVRSLGRAMDGLSRFENKSLNGSGALSDFVDQLLYDMNFLKQKKSQATLLKLPLWKKGMPNWVEDEWSDFENELLGIKEEFWQVWIKRLKQSGSRSNITQNELELDNQILSLPEYVWEQGPAVVNQRIVEIEAEAFEARTSELEAKTATNEEFVLNPAGKIERIIVPFDDQRILQNAVYKLKQLIKYTDKNFFNSESLEIQLLSDAVTEQPDNALCLYDAVQRSLRIVAQRAKSDSIDDKNPQVVDFYATLFDVRDDLSKTGDSALGKVREARVQTLPDSATSAELVRGLKEMRGLVDKTWLEDFDATTEVIENSGDLSGTEPMGVQSDIRDLSELSADPAFRWEIALSRSAGRVTRIWRVLKAVAKPTAAILGSIGSIASIIGLYLYIFGS